MRQDSDWALIPQDGPQPPPRWGHWPRPAAKNEIYVVPPVILRWLERDEDGTEPVGPDGVMEVASDVLGTSMLILVYQMKNERRRDL